MATRPANCYRFLVPEIRLGEFDLGGVLYHAHYFHLYELAREAFLRDQGLPYTGFVEQEQHLAIVESHQLFKAPVRYGDRLELHLWVSDLGRSSFTFHYSIVPLKDGDKRSELHSAWTRHVFVAKLDSDFKAIRLPETLLKAIERFQ